MEMWGVGQKEESVGNVGTELNRTRDGNTEQIEGQTWVQPAGVG